VVSVFSAFLVGIVSTKGDAPPPAQEIFKQWGQAQIVFIGKLDRVDAGPVGRSFPPMYTHQLHFSVDEVLRGSLATDKPATLSHVARQHAVPTFPGGKTCLVAASKARGSLRAQRVVEANPTLVAQVRQVCAIPLGWSFDDGKLVSPWAKLRTAAWPAAVSSPGLMTCSQTGRPALLVGPDVRLDVEPVPPEKSIKWTNPDGDGEYKITVTNTADQPVEVPALLFDGKQVLWNESIVILCQDRAYTAPGAKGVATVPKPTTLQPGQSVSAVVNALALRGPEWPRGGYRIEFQFCLGEKSSTQSFYYMSRHHDALRDKAGGG
jgi:hypothetical protein